MKTNAVCLEGCRSYYADLSGVLTYEPKSLTQISLESKTARSTLHNRLSRLLDAGIVKKSIVADVKTSKRDGKPYRILRRESFYFLAEDAEKLNGLAAEKRLRASDFDVLRALARVNKPSRSYEVRGELFEPVSAADVTYALRRLHSAGYARFYVATPKKRAVKFWSATQEGMARAENPCEDPNLLQNLFFLNPPVIRLGGRVFLEAV